MKISVTETDIRQGRPKRCNCCPIALAIRRTMPGHLVAVDPDRITIGIMSYVTPEPAQDFMAKFDCGSPVIPFEFELNLEQAA